MTRKRVSDKKTLSWHPYHTRLNFEFESDEFDEIDKLLIAEGVMTEEEVREAKKRAEGWDVEDMIDNPDRVLEEADEDGSPDT
ncbi:MAG: hypothetical protein U5J64_11055 [Halobacteriales archaeon]|nr:hypothetical protein [Halobacteriales archaeon]